jgi:proteasome lid subunit RPN8/RPN11
MQATAAIKEHVCNSRHRECCGFLLGRHAEDGFEIEQAVAVSNTAVSISFFSVPQYEYKRIKDFAQERKLQIVALYHNHPNRAASLSDADKRTLSRSDIHWVIVTINSNRKDCTPNLSAYEARTYRPIDIQRKRGGYPMM